MQHPVRFALSLSLLAAACGSSPAGKPPGDGGQDVAGHPGDIAATKVGAAGATLSSEAVTVRVPAGALTADVWLSVTRLGAESTATLPAATAVGLEGVAELSNELFAFTPHGTTFTMPVEIEILHQGQGNVVLRLDDEQDTTWEFVPGATFDAGKARFQVTHFSVYAVASAMRICQRAFCTSLPAGAKCGVVKDPCNGQVDLVTDCGRGCDANMGCNDNNECGPCKSDFNCATTTAKCGVLIDNCGNSHDVTAECPAIKGCGARGSCTPLNLCSASCTPYATCAEAANAEGFTPEDCSPKLSNGCGGTMDCSNRCTGNQHCFRSADPYQPPDTYFCAYPCPACPTIANAIPICQHAYCEYASF